MELSYQEKFIKKLEEHYGIWDRLTSNFGSTSFGYIAKDLCISNSQFTKLIYGTATEGMYIRSIDNVERLLKHDQLTSTQASLINKTHQLENNLHSLESKRSRISKLQPWIIFGAFL